MKLNEVLPEFEKGKLIRRTSWNKEYYFKYDFSFGVIKDRDNHQEGFSYLDVKADDWEFVQTVEDKQLKKLYNILSTYNIAYNYSTLSGLKPEAYKDELLEVLRMK
ncbi:hypothetical protein AB0X79_07885 [Pediococcus pentosaceus]|uniref:hypothetical protein n=1 Tax=Pediococcus pentosaceus TaxID=1255 RepID=UPI003F1EB0A5